MSFAKFSSDYLLETFTLVDNLFINEYLPSCDEKQIKAYLYGLYLCSNPAKDNSVDALCAKLDMTENELFAIYSDFEDDGLIKIISREPLEIKYLSLKKSMQPPKKYKGDKWNDFNAHLQLLFPERMLTPNEYNEYYLFLDATKMDQDAMLMIVQYCIDLKGANVRYPYILAVARNWAQDGVHTAADVEDKLKEYDTQTEQMRTVLAALGRKGGAELEEKQMLLKWTRSWGYELDAILATIKTMKGAKSFKKLDSKLDEFYRTSIFTAEQIKDYQAHMDMLRDIALAVNKTLGVFYESLDHEIEVYIVPWTTKGFDGEALKKIAHHCFITNVRNLEGMKNVVNSFYSLGILTSEGIDRYLQTQIERDAKIKAILAKSGNVRAVTQSDRDAYRTWTAVWGFDDDVIEYAASLAVGRTYPVPYINQRLSGYKAKGISTGEQAQRTGTATQTAPPSDHKERVYTAEELKSIVRSIDTFSDSDL